MLMKNRCFGFLIFTLTFLVSCSDQSGKSSTDNFIDSLDKAAKVDSIISARMKAVMTDTTGLHTSPIQVTKATISQQSYSNFKDINLTYKNVSTKKVEAIRFRWYGENAFGEPADMGSYTSKGVGSGYDDDPISAGKSRTSSWSLTTSNVKKVVMAWAYEVVYEDGTKWKIN